MSGNAVFGQTSIIDWKSVENICRELDMEIEIVEKKGLSLNLRWLWHRKGIILGFTVGLIMITLLSNIMLQVRFKGGNDETKQLLLNYMKDKNISYGCFMPSIDTFNLELEMLQEFDEISWIGIYKTGGTLNIDLIESYAKTENSQRRLPSDLIASHDGKIVKVEVFGGALLTTVGSGVHKGQVLVSGKVQLSDTETKMYRSEGNIYAEYVETVSFNCNYEDERMVMLPDVEKRYFLKFYEIDLPLTFSKKIKGQYKTKDKINKLSFLGIDLPINVKSVEYTPYNFDVVNYSKEEAEKEAYRLSKNYEDNLLKNCEILDKKESISHSENGIKLDVTYTVIKNIAVEKEILIK